jgi:hypothetical protein
MTDACKLEDLSGQILEHSGHVNGGLGANTRLFLSACLEESLDTTAGELEVIEVNS